MNILLVQDSVLQKEALDRYEAVRGGGDERLISGSDDFTMMLWYPEKDKKSLGKILQRDCSMFFK